MYERISQESEQRGTAAQRDRALAGLTGRVIEIGAGNGMNFSHYPDTVTEVVAVEPEDSLRRHAARLKLDVTRFERELRDHIHRRRVLASPVIGDYFNRRAYHRFKATLHVLSPLNRQVLVLKRSARFTGVSPDVNRQIPILDNRKEIGLSD